MRNVAAGRACAVLTALSILSLSGCGTDRTISPFPSAPQAAVVAATLASVTVTPASDTINAIGFTAPFKAVARDASGNVVTGVTVSWSSVNAARVTVNQSGLVTSTGRGWVRIIAAAGGKADTSEVWSRQIVASTSVSPATGTMPVGGTVQLAATAKDSNNVVAPKATFAWSSSNTAVAVVNSGGLVTGVAAGTATIRATSSGKGANAAITVSGAGSSGGVWKLVHAGTNHSCGITSAGSTQCWGSGVYGQLGIGQPGGSATPVEVLGGHVFTTLWAGDRTNCAIKPSGAAWCWGIDYFGSAGNGRDPGNHCHPYPDESCDNGPEQHVPVRVVGSQVWTQVTSGFHHSCGLTSTGQAWCWGGNANGQIGTTAFTGLTGRCTDFAFGFFHCSDAPVPVVGGLTFKQIAAGFWHTCAVTTAGKAYCWGANPSGQLGDGTNIERHVPTPVAGNLVFAAVSALFEHTCGVTISGEAWCWGQGQLGRLGDGTHNLSRVPRKVLNLPPVKRVTAGG